jgi:hypothetical protein
MMRLILTVFSNIGENVQYNNVVSVKCIMKKCVAARHYGVIGKQLFISNDRHTVR